MSLGQTLQRFLALSGLSKPTFSPNLLVNPLFEHIQTDISTKKFSVPTQFAATFQSAPGWYDFGGITNGLIEAPSDPLDGAIPTAFSRSGVKITQTKELQKGICQKIFRGAILKGKTIRVSGQYTIPVGGTPDNLTGVSIWLKSDKQNATGAVVGSDWGQVAWISAGNTEPDGPFYNAIRLNMTKIQHVIRLAPSGVATYEAGEELFYRAFDWWGHGVGDISSQTFPPLSDIQAPDSYIALGGGDATNKRNGVYDRQDVRVWYLDDQFDDDDATGTQELHTETKGVAGTYNFEVFVDVADTVVGAGTLFEDNEVWVVVMPVHPGDAGSMTDDAVVVLKHLNVEIVLKSNETDDQLLGAALNQSSKLPAGMGFGGVSPREMLQYPIFVPCVYKLDVHPTAVTDAGDWASVETSISHGGVVDCYTYATATTNKLISHQRACLPPGSSVVGAQIHTYVYDAGDELNNLTLWQMSSRDPAAAGTGERLATVGVWAPSITVDDAEREADVVRNRIGGFWPDLGNEVAIDTVGSMAAGALVLTYTIVTVGAMGLEGDYLYALVDPRWNHAVWRFGEV